MYEQLKSGSMEIISLTKRYLKHCFLQCVRRSSCWMKMKWFSSLIERLLLEMISIIYHLEWSHALLVAGPKV